MPATDHDVFLSEHWSDAAWRAWCGSCTWVSRWVRADEFTDPDLAISDPFDTAHDVAQDIGNTHGDCRGDE